MLSLIEGHELVILGEGVDLFALPLPRSLHGKTLAATEIGSRTGLSVVAVEQRGQLVTNLRASMTLEAGAELIMLGSVQQRRDFAGRFGPVRAASPARPDQPPAASRAAGRRGPSGYRGPAGRAPAYAAR